jgi:hypothetical protein
MKKVKINRAYEDPHGLLIEPNVPWERPAGWKIPVTLGEEVEQAIAEWYGRRGLPIPKDEIGVGAKIDEAELEFRQQEMKGIIEYEKKKEEAPAGEKPEFGTPEFWAWARKRKKEKEAERAAKGLAPLPTKKEKEALKAAKEAEKVAKASEKVAKAAAKEEKKKAK